MKYLILFFIPGISFACNSYIAESEIADAIALKPGVGAKKCDASDICICYDGVDWRTAAFDPETKRFSLDQSKKNALTNEEETKRVDSVNKKIEFNSLKEKIQSETATTTEVMKLLKHILRKLGE